MEDYKYKKIKTVEEFMKQGEETLVRLVGIPVTMKEGDRMGYIDINGEFLEFQEDEGIFLLEIIELANKGSKKMIFEGYKREKLLQVFGGELSNLSYKVINKKERLINGKKFERYTSSKY